MVFRGQTFSVSKFDEKTVLSLTCAEQNILIALDAFKKLILKKIIMLRRTIYFVDKRKIKFDSVKNIAPPPFKLNGCSLKYLLLSKQYQSDYISIVLRHSFLEVTSTVYRVTIILITVLLNIVLMSN